MTEETWIEYLNRSKKWAIRIEFGLIHSQAYLDLDYAPALKVLNWFYEKPEVHVNKMRRGKIQYQVANNGELSFPYKEAELRGLTPQKFRKALLELHRVGFIDVKRPGSSFKGDHTIYLLSERWRAYGTPDFERKDFPKSVHWFNFGFSTKEKKLTVRIHS